MLKINLEFKGAYHYIKEDTKLVLNFSRNFDLGMSGLLWLDIILMDRWEDVEHHRIGGLIFPNSKGLNILETWISSIENLYEMDFSIEKLTNAVFHVASEYTETEILRLSLLRGPLRDQEVEERWFFPSEEGEDEEAIQDDEVVEEEVVEEVVVEEVVEEVEEREEEIIEREEKILNLMEPTLSQAMEFVPVYERKKFYGELLPEEKIKGAVEIKFFLEVGPGGNTGWDKHLKLMIKKRIDPTSCLCTRDYINVGYSRYPLKDHMAAMDRHGVQRYIADCINEWYCKNQ